MGIAERRRAARYRTTLSSPLGPLTLSSDGRSLTGISFGMDLAREPSPAGGVLEEVARALDRYWTGERLQLGVPLALDGTPFQMHVWRGLLEIPYGETTTYAELARSVGAPRAVRAVGRANGANPIPIVVPCHRVVGSDGSLTGYGGGMEAKRWLLDLERGATRSVPERLRLPEPSTRTARA